MEYFNSVLITSDTWLTTPGIQELGHLFISVPFDFSD